MSDFYTVNEQELLTATSIGKAVIEFLDESELEPKDFPETVMVQGFMPMKASMSVFDFERIIESLDDEYANHETGGTKITQPMKDAWREFEKVILSEYKVWLCEHDGEPVKVIVADYVRRKG